jgi:hypothetical protein
VNTSRSEPSKSQLVGNVVEVVDVFVDDMVLVVDEFVIGFRVLVLKLLLDDERLNVVGGSMTGTVLLELEVALVLVTIVEEFAVEVKIKLELDLLLRLEVVEIVDELEIGYKTLLELDLLFDLEVRAEVVVPVVGTVVSVVLSLELETTGLDGERLVDTDERVDPEGLVNAEELLDTRRLDDARLDDAELDDTVGLKMTIAKI